MSRPLAETPGKVHGMQSGDGRISKERASERYEVGNQMGSHRPFPRGASARQAIDLHTTKLRFPVQAGPQRLWWGRGGDDMTLIEILLSSGAVIFGISVVIAVWRTLPDPDDALPDLELARKFIAATPQRELRAILEPKDRGSRADAIP